MAVHGIIGRKVGMTQIFRADGTVVPVTVVQAGPCLVVQKKTADKDGYDALQIGLVEARPDRRANQRREGPLREGRRRADAHAHGSARRRGRRVEAGRQGPLRHVRRAGPRRRHRNLQGQGLHGRRRRGTASAAARRPTARCSTGRRARSAPRRSRRASIRARGPRAGWAAGSRRPRTWSSCASTPRRTSSI